MKKALRFSWTLFVGAFFPFSAFAEEAAHATTSSGLAGLGVGLGIGIAVLGAGLGQGKVGAAFMDGVSRNPSAQKQMFVPLLIALAFVETLVLFTFLVVQGLLGKI